MASIRPGKCYRWDSPAYTRVAKNPSDSFITGIPGSKIVHFDMGNSKGEYDAQAKIVYTSRMQVRHNALEAARIMIQKKLENELGVANYFFKINVHPHHVLRENVMASGAGADRVSDGMRKAYGKPIGRAARVQKDQTLLTIKFKDSEPRRKLMKRVLKIASNKLPGEKRITITEIT